MDVAVAKCPSNRMEDILLAGNGVAFSSRAGVWGSFQRIRRFMHLAK